MPAFEFRSVATEVDGSMVQELLIARLSGFFGVLRLLLVSVGLYGLVAYAGGRRTRELGLRMALGAQPGNLIWIVMREVLLLTTCGLVLGLATAVGGSRLASSLLFGLTPTDPA